MKRLSFFIMSIILAASFIIYAADDKSKNDDSLIQITDQSVKPKKMKVSAFEPAKVSPRIETKDLEKTYSYKRMAEFPGKYLTGSIPPDGLTEKGKDAVAIAPYWLRGDLADLFKRLNSEKRQDIWAQLIIDNATEKYIDELIFTIAHSSAWFMKQAFANPDAFLGNARMIYVVDADVSYADIVDYGEPGVDDDYYSTTKYWTLTAEGEKVQREYDRNLYYWYVVHPKLSDDDPSIGASGLFWREYYYYDVVGKQSYSTFCCLKNPNTITEDDVNGWNYSSYGYIQGCHDWIYSRIAAKDTGEGVLVSWARSNGCVIATMMPVDKGENDGQRKLLENMVYNGNGEITIRQMLPNPNTKVGIGIFQDRNPWGKTEIETAINKFGNPFRMFTSADMATFELTGPYKKIIIPSDQPRAFYEALSANKARFESWVGNYGVFEFHGACSPENDWTDLDMPFGIKAVMTEDSMTDSLEFRKFPTMEEVLKLADVVWDAKTSVSLPKRPFEQGNTALDILSNWSCYNMPFNAHNTRPNQPEQIVFEHDGNCGEIQDIIAAAGRVALVPMSCTDGFVEDHVWNEFYDDGWYFLNNDWFGNSSAIGYPGGHQDVDYGGGKNISVMRRNRGDSFNENITAAYTKNCTLDVHVYDKNGYPVDGANVQIWTEFYYSTPDNPQYVEPIEYSTDCNGFAGFVLGDSRNYWVRVESPIGNYPTTGDMVQVIETSEPDKLYTWECNLTGEIKILDAEKIEYNPGNTIYSLVADLKVDGECIYGQTTGMGYCEPSVTGKFDYFICDSDNLVKYLAGEQFDAFEFMEDIDQATTTLAIKGEERYFVVLSNEKRVRNSEQVSLTVHFNDQPADYIRNLASYAVDLRLHAGERIVVALNNKQPFILAAGFFDTSITKAGGGELILRALVMDPDGYDDIDHVELVKDGKKTGNYLTDDGVGADTKAKDSLFSYSQFVFAKSMNVGLYKNYGVVAVDKMGFESMIWPQFHVESQGAALMLVEPDSYMGIQNDEALSFLNFYRTLNQYDSTPIILAGGYGTTSLTAENGGLLTYLAALPAGQTYKVEILFNETPLGIYLQDNGTGGDLVKGDGVYTFSMNFKIFPAGDYTLELQASDGQGNKSTIFPYFEVTE